MSTPSIESTKSIFSIRVRLLVRAAAALLGAALLVGCAGNYNDRVRPAKQAFAQGQYDQARELILQRIGKKKKAPLAYLLELSMIDQAAGRWQASTEALHTARDVIRENEKRAIVSARETAQQAGTLLVNERMQDYEGEAFEKILVHTFAAINYLMAHDWNGARVESLRAYQRQREVERLRQAQIQAAQRQWNSNRAQFNRQKTKQNFNKAFAQQDPVANRVANAYQNAFTNFVCAVVYNQLREPGEAYIELKKANKLRPGAPCLGPILIETAAAAGFGGDLPNWERAYGLNAQSVLDWAKRNPAEVVVLFESGWAPIKRQITIPIPTPWAIGFLALPRYQFLGGEPNQLHVSVGGQQARTTLMADIEGQAARALRDRMFAYVARGAVRVAIRLAAEYELHRQLEEERKKRIREGKDPGNAPEMAFVASTAFNAAIEKADVRAWTFLPKNMQIARLRVPAGPTRVEFKTEGGRLFYQSKLDLDLKAERPTVILVRATGNVMTAHANTAAAPGK